MVKKPFWYDTQEELLVYVKCHPLTYVSILNTLLFLKMQIISTKFNSSIKLCK